MMTSFVWWNVYNSDEYAIKYFHVGLYLKGFAHHLVLSVRFRRIKGVDKPIRIFTHCNKWTDEDVKTEERLVKGG